MAAMRTVAVSISTNVVSGLDWYFLYSMCSCTVVMVTAATQSKIQNIVRIQCRDAFILPKPCAEVYSQKSLMSDRKLGVGSLRSAYVASASFSGLNLSRSSISTEV